MAINFAVSDVLLVRQNYVENTLKHASVLFGGVSRASNVRLTLENLGRLNRAPNTVLATGSQTIFATLDDGQTAVTRSFIQLLPMDVTSEIYNAGNGVVIYWEDDATLNEMFEKSTSFLMDTRFERGSNTSGGTITKGEVVRISGFDATNHLPTIALASAAGAATAGVFGIAAETIADMSLGAVLVQGTFQGLDTSSFTINEFLFLSDTPGAIVASPGGTVAALVGRAISIATAPNGVVLVEGLLPILSTGAAGPSGAPGQTGISGATGIQGGTGIDGGTGIEGSTGIAGTGMQFRTSFTQATLVGNVLTVNHGFGVRYNVVAIYDDTNAAITTATVTDIDANNLTVDFSAISPISGTWNVVVLG
jgi:hypothetical protein